MSEPTLRQELVALAYGMHPEVFQAVLEVAERRIAEALERQRSRDAAA